MALNAYHHALLGIFRTSSQSVRYVPLAAGNAHPHQQTVLNALRALTFTTIHAYPPAHPAPFPNPNPKNASPAWVHVTNARAMSTAHHAPTACIFTLAKSQTMVNASPSAPMGIIPR